MDDNIFVAPANVLTLLGVQWLIGQKMFLPGCGPAKASMVVLFDPVDLNPGGVEGSCQSRPRTSSKQKEEIPLHFIMALQNFNAICIFVPIFSGPQTRYSLCFHGCYFISI